MNPWLLKAVGVNSRQLWPAALVFAPDSDQQTTGKLKHWLVLSQGESLPSQLLASGFWVRCLHRARTSARGAVEAGSSSRLVT